MSNYYDYREVKVMIAHKLMSLKGKGNIIR